MLIPAQAFHPKPFFVRLFFQNENKLFLRTTHVIFIEVKNVICTSTIKTQRKCSCSFVKLRVYNFAGCKVYNRRKERDERDDGLCVCVCWVVRSVASGKWMEEGLA